MNAYFFDSHRDVVKVLLYDIASLFSLLRNTMRKIMRQRIESLRAVATSRVESVVGVPKAAVKSHHAIYNVIYALFYHS